jgi:Bd3614-like deaminase
MNDEKTIQKLIGFLNKESPEFEFSVVRHQNQFYFSRFRKGLWAPSSATIKLIQGLFDQNRDLSFFILRNRIFTTEEITPSIRNVVKLTAKRISQVEPIFEADFAPTLLHEVGQANDLVFPWRSIQHDVHPGFLPAKILSEVEALTCMQMLIDLIPRGDILHDWNRSVVALLVSGRGDLLEWSINQAALNKTLHAELNLIQKYFRRTGRKIPALSQIFVSLKPCRMCASLLKDACEDFSSNQFWYWHEDPGSMARDTELDRVVRKML